MVPRGAEFVAVCYFLRGAHTCTTVRKEDAYRLRAYVEASNGTIYWFNPG